MSADEFPNIGGWNYRIAKLGEGELAYYRLYEVYYDEDGNEVLWSETNAHGQSIDEIIADLERMLADAKHSRETPFEVPNWEEMEAEERKRNGY
jgi:hypothetical protein